MKTPLWPHQEPAVEWAYARRGSMFAAWMGTGKTLMSLTLLERWNCGRTIVAAPLAVISHWAAQTREHVGNHWRVVELDEGSVADKLDHAKMVLAASACPVILAINHGIFSVIHHGPQYVGNIEQPRMHG